MNPSCEKCKGACCKTITLATPNDSALRDFFLLRGTRTDEGINFAIPCKRLCDGLCTAYEERPAPCRELQPGDATCRAIVLRQRGPLGYATIFHV